MDTHDHLTGQRHYDVTINDTSLVLHDPIVTGRDLLSAADLDPASEHILIQVAHKLTRLIGLEDQVDLTANPNSSFRATFSDRAYAFTIDEHGYIWGGADIKVRDLRHIAGTHDDTDLVLERRGEPDLVLDIEGSVDLGQPGSQHIHSKKRDAEFVMITVYATGGIYPEEGAVRERRTQPVNHVLHLAATSLGLTDTAGWIVMAADTEIDPTQSYVALGLSGQVSLDWQPREGGGGNA